MQERNKIWERLEEIIEECGLKNSSEFLDPIEDNIVIFGNFIKGDNPITFISQFNNVVEKIKSELPKEYDIAKSYIYEETSGTIGIYKRV